VRLTGDRRLTARHRRSSKETAGFGAILSTGITRSPPHFLGGRSTGVIRHGDFKLIEFYDTGKVELYNLRNDIGEQRDLAPAMPGKVSKLRRMFDAWRK